MTADIVSSRLPLMEQNCYSYSDRSTSIDRQLSYAMHPSSPSTYDTFTTTASESLFTICAPGESVPPPADASANPNAVTTLSNNNGAFRYQIRRPVESWKFVESRSTEGVILYLCRVCSSSYKHKKSLNKHWKDKHSDLPRPEGAIADEEDDDGEAEDEDSDTELYPPHLIPATIDQYSGELSDTENRPPGDALLFNQQRSSERRLPSSANGKNVSISTHGRRYSTPHFRTHRPLSSSSRYSFVPQRQNFHDAVMRPTDQPHKRRFKYMESPPQIGKQRPRGAPNGYERNSYDATRQIPMKRVETFAQGGPNTTTSIEQNNQYSACVNNNVSQNDGKIFEDGSYLNTSVSNQRLELESSSIELPSGTMPKHTNSTSANNHRSPRRLIREYQPLDLSLQKNIGPVGETSQMDSLTNTSSQHNDATGKSKVVNRFLLIELLQTAINVLKDESIKNDQSFSHLQSQVVSEDQQVKSTAFLVLSQSSASLLTAIGNLLVALVDRQATCDVDSRRYGLVGTSDSDIINSKPITRILPPAPSTIIDGPAVDIPQQLNDIDSPQSPSSSTVVNNNVTGPPVSSIKGNSSEHGTANESKRYRNVQQHGVLPKGEPGSHHSAISADSHNQRNTIISQNLAGIPQYANFHQKTSTLPYQPMSSVICQSSTPFSAIGGAANTSNNVNYQLNNHLVNIGDVTTSTHCQETQETQETHIIMCPVCKFEARWFSELRAHMVNHSDHRMFGCCYCNYRAKWKWDVAKHMRRCPLGRHVAHFTNEALLRMICYFPPPSGNILYNYFPQDEFPGVGIDRPPTPPNHITEDSSEYVKNSGIAKPNSFSQSAPVSETLSSLTETDPITVMEYQHNPYHRASEFDEVISPESSPTRLVIVDDEFQDNGYSSAIAQESTVSSGIKDFRKSCLGTLVDERLTLTDQCGILKQFNSNTAVSTVPQTRMHDPT